ncbi:hypothetical protein ACIGQE_27475 [Streptomyces sp. NPDC053429]|uniref:hypothetical protein n=1 Tax=Streptomyces sp. NPDC053429 TaxID=3365702 RepID=UPI0037D685EE
MDLRAMYYSPVGGAGWTFNAESTGMGNFSVWLGYTGDEPVVPDIRIPISTGWPGLTGTTFASGIDAACTVPDGARSVWLFKGDQYLPIRHRCPQHQ